MKIHEYQAKTFFKKYNLPVPKGLPAFSVAEAVKVAPQVSAHGPWVVKAQIHAGGRGKAGGVKIAKTLKEVEDYSQKILGMTLVTPQTGPEGKVVQRLYIEEGSQIDKELYLAITLDRANSKLCFIASVAGGMDIEEVAHETPEKIFKEWVEPSVGLRDYQIRRLSGKFGFQGNAAKQFPSVLRNLLKFYQDYDGALLEINPLVLTKSGDLVALDGKVLFDDNAMYRHHDLNELFDPNEEDPQELEARKFELSYISLDGNIGCMVNGAGLAMATMDIIKLEGGNPANFLDVGGGASEEKVKQAFKIILQDKKVKAILINIFGGIMKCDVIANGVIAAAKELSIHVPIVCRLEGTNVELGKKILQSSGLKIETANGMKDAAQKVVKAAGGSK